MIGKPAPYRGRTVPFTDEQLLSRRSVAGWPALTFDERVRLAKLRKGKKRGRPFMKAKP